MSNDEESTLVNRVHKFFHNGFTIIRSLQNIREKSTFDARVLALNRAHIWYIFNSLIVAHPCSKYMVLTGSGRSAVSAELGRHERGQLFRFTKFDQSTAYFTKCLTEKRGYSIANLRILRNLKLSHLPSSRNL
jgi:hypothetical protein